MVQGASRPIDLHFSLGPITKVAHEESPIPLSMQNYKFVIVEIEKKDGDLEPGYYLCSLTPKEAWERL
jgi:hypothetical protein